MDENKLSYVIIKCAIEVHRELGCGLLESVYEEALAHELTQAGLTVSRQKSVPVIYKGIRLASVLRLDMLVNESVIIECKSCVENNPYFEAQCLTYLRLSGLKLGLVINFGKYLLHHGVNRVANNL